MDSPPFAFSASFQLTSSRRGWRLCNSWFGCRRGISTHILTKRMTTNPTITFKAGTFQLTSSRRGWPNAYKRGSSCGRYFNSHPHEEDDIALYTPSLVVFLFQLTSSRRGWPTDHISTNTESHFNSHPHEEDDLILVIYYNIYGNFNSHPHEEDDVICFTYTLELSISTHILTKRMTG